MCLSSRHLYLGVLYLYLRVPEKGEGKKEAVLGEKVLDTHLGSCGFTHNFRTPVGKGPVENGWSGRMSLAESYEGTPRSVRGSTSLYSDIRPFLVGVVRVVLPRTDNVNRTEVYRRTLLPGPRVGWDVRSTGVSGKTIFSSKISFTVMVSICPSTVVLFPVK